MQMISLDSLKKKLANYPHLSEIEDFLNKILASTSPELIVLFGSLSTGRFTQYSDIDILCVFDIDFQNNRERFHYSYRFSNGIVQTKTITLIEFISGLENGNSFLYSILEKGYILHSKMNNDDLDNFLYKCKSKLKVIYFHP